MHDGEDISTCLTDVKKHGITLGVSQHASKSITRLIGDGKLERVLDRLRPLADYVILDTPPMMVAADAEAIAALVDTAILVVRADFMPTSSINEGLDRLRKSAPELCGFVLNNYHTVSE
jgi:Mrp family chromosome partitioning ATPase